MICKITILPEYTDCLEKISQGQYVHVFMWFHEAKRGTKKVHTLHDPSLGLRGVFATRSPDRPNPIGVTLVEILKLDGLTLDVRGLDALDGTPVIDIKPFIQDIDSLPWEEQT